MTKLTNLEICKRIAEIEDKEFYLLVSDGKTYPMIKEWQDSVLVGKGIPKKFSSSYDYNPLTDDALCFKLMIKYRVHITWNPHINNNCTAVIDGECDDIPFSFAIADNNNKIPNKAICLTIIEAYKDK